MTEAWEPQIEPRATKPASGGFPVGLTVATLIGLAILIGLGVWQLQRLKWKEGLLAHIAALQSAPARPIEPVLDALSQGRDVDFTRVTVVCPGLASAPYLEMYDLRDGQTGKRLISVCPIETAAHGFRSILVDRGFVADTVTGPPGRSIRRQRPPRSRWSASCASPSAATSSPRRAGRSAGSCATPPGWPGNSRRPRRRPIS